MVDRITKALRKLSDKESRSLQRLLRQIKAGDVGGLDVRKLKGHRDIYRVRRGRMRVIYRMDRNGTVSILTVEHRTDTTYHSW